MNEDIKIRDFSEEFIFITSRSKGAGGQHVNKVNTKVELRFNVNNSVELTEEEKVIIKQKLVNKINNEGFLIIVSQTERSQIMNKKKAIERFYILIEKALKPVKKRKPTKPTLASIKKRLQEKHIKSEKKILRKGIDI